MSMLHAYFTLKCKKYVNDSQILNVTSVFSTLFLNYIPWCHCPIIMTCRDAQGLTFN